MRELDPAPPTENRPITAALPPFPDVVCGVGRGIPLLRSTAALPQDADNFSTAGAFVMTGRRA